MNKQINDLNYDEYLFLDIETSRQVEELTENHPHYDVWRYKQRDKDTQELPTHEETVKSYKDKSALLAEFGKIVCISIGYINGDAIVTKSYTGDEKEILKDAVKAIKASGRKLALHNSSFDIPFIRKRWFINGLPYKDYMFSDAGLKQWDAEKLLVDTMILWKGFSFTNTSLDELAMCFGIPSSKDGEVVGSNVGDAYFAGKIDAIAEYCEKDVVVVANLLRKLKGDDLLIHISKTGQETKEEEQPILLEIYNSKELNIDKLKDYLKERNYTSDDFEEVRDIILSVYLDKSDKKGDINTKTKEVEQILNQC